MRSAHHGLGVDHLVSHHLLSVADRRVATRALTLARDRARAPSCTFRSILPSPPLAKGRSVEASNINSRTAGAFATREQELESPIATHNSKIVADARAQVADVAHTPAAARSSAFHSLALPTADKGQFVRDCARAGLVRPHSNRWLGYSGLGGMRTAPEAQAFRVEVIQPTLHDHDLIAQARSERCVEQAQNQSVPYLADKKDLS